MGLILSLKNFLNEVLEDWQLEKNESEHNPFKKIDKKIDKKIRKINNEIKSIDAEIFICTRTDEFKDMVEIKKNVLQSLEDRRKLIIQSEVDKFVNKFPVYIFMGWYSKKDIGVMLKNKTLTEMLSLLVKNKFGKDKFSFINCGGKFEENIHQINRLKYWRHFKNKFNVLNLTDRHIEDELTSIDPGYLNVVNVKRRIK